MNDVENNKDLQRGASQTKHLRTTAQLPVYRTAANILFLLTEITRDVPRKLLRFTDRVLLDASELLKTIALANEFRDEERRLHAVTCAATLLSSLVNWVVCSLRM